MMFSSRVIGSEFFFFRDTSLLNERARVIIYVHSEVRHNRLDTTLLAILDEIRIAEQCHSQKPAVDRPVRHARKAELTSIS